MQQILTQIENKKVEKKKVENDLNSISSTITKSKNKIIVINNDIEKIKSRINKNKHEIKNMVFSFQITLFQKIIEFLSFGSIDYRKDHFKSIEKVKKNIKKLENQVFEKKQNITNENNNIANLTSMQQKTQIAIETLKEKLMHLQNEFNKKLMQFKDELLSVQMALMTLSEEQYINDYIRKKQKAELSRIVENKEKFLTHEKIKNSLKELINFYTNSKQWIEEKNKLFIKNEKENEKHFFETIESNPLTEMQMEAVLVNENNNLVLAGAGSGKTSVIVAKVSYLIKKKILHPNEILILAFNKNAQIELEERFSEKNLPVQIKTFHSFGLSIIGEALGQCPDLCPMTESQNNMTKFIKDTIRELMSSMGIFFEQFLEFIAYFSIPYKDESNFKSLGEYYDYQKSYDMKTLKHEVEVKGERQREALKTLQEETVKSYQELVIANFLTLNGIKYMYEERYEHNTANQKKRQYKPDFYLPDYGIYIEHFGIDRNGRTAPYIDNEKYLADIQWKIALHEEYNTTLVQTFSYEFTEKKLLNLLKEKLLKHNVIFRELEFAEISELLKDPIENNKFTKLFTTFLNHYKSNMHSMVELKKKSKDIERTTLFLKLFEFIFNEYVSFQEQNNCIDFDDMIVKALTSVKNGKYKHGFKHIFIDEFQDISTTRAKLIQSLLPINDTSITAVGDDWQSINRFAGSNIKIIQDFEKTFGISETVALDYTFRFNNIVSSVASNFVEKNPHQIKKEIKTKKNQDLNKFSILLYWTTGDSWVDMEKILSLILKKEKDNKPKVMVLARYNFLLKDLRDLQGKYQNLDLSFSTVHGSKGNEADYVIVLNIDKGKFGFPSKIEDDPILDIVIPEGDDFEDAEERRLFYVALTRTKNALFLLSDKYNESPFISELIDNRKDEIFFINDPKIKLMNCPECKSGLLKKRTEARNRNNHFYGCSNFPRCKYTENVHYCPECNSEMFKDDENKIAECSNEECVFDSLLCIKCNGYMIERKGQYGEFLGCSQYPTCKHTETIRS